MGKLEWHSVEQTPPFSNSLLCFSDRAVSIKFLMQYFSKFTEKTFHGNTGIDGY